MQSHLPLQTLFGQVKEPFLLEGPLIKWEPPLFCRPLLDDFPHVHFVVAAVSLAAIQVIEN